MVEGLENLAKMEYPGRVIMVGQNSYGENIVVYGLSGRSTSSKARRLLSSERKFSSSRMEEGMMKVFTEPTDPEALAKGDPALLIYNAIISYGSITIVSNGAQTDSIDCCVYANKKTYRVVNTNDIPVNDILLNTFSEPDIIKTKDGREIDLAIHEPDDPIYTPRISGIIKDDYVMLSIATRDANEMPLMTYHEFNLMPGVGKMIATYDGPNPEKPAIVPSFQGYPRDVCFGNNKAHDLVKEVYDAMGEFAVGVACVMPEQNIIKIKNLHEVE